VTADQLLTHPFNAGVAVSSIATAAWGIGKALPIDASASPA
jgi:hypothetical protein